MNWFDDMKKYYVFRALVKRIIVPVLTIYMVDQGFSIPEIAVAASVGWASASIAEVPSGAFADWFGHKRTLLLSMAGQALSMLLYLGGGFWWVLAGTGCYFIASSFMTGTAEALFFERLKEDGAEANHQRLSGRAKAFANTVSMVAMVLSGLLYAVAWWLPFIAGFIQFVLGGLVIAPFREAKRPVSVQKREGFSDLVAHLPRAYRTLHSRRPLFWLVVMSALVNGIAFGSGEFQQIIFANAGILVASFGFIYAAKRLIAIFVYANVHTFTERYGLRVFLCWVAVVWFTYFPLMASGNTILILIASTGLGTIAWTATEIVLNDVVNQNIPSTSRATTLSLTNLSRNAVNIATVAAFSLATYVVTIEHSYLWIGSFGFLLILFSLLQYIRSSKSYNTFKTS